VNVDVLQPNVASYQFGGGVSGGGDLDGDGYSDVIIGAPVANPAFAGEGGMFWYRGNGARSLGRLSRQYDADLVSPLSTNSLDFSTPGYFGIGHRARSSIHRCKARLRWQVVYQGQPFTGSPITNSLLCTGTGASWTTLPLSGSEIKQLVYKVPGALRYKWRVRVEYDMAKLITGQRFSRWFYGYANSVGDIGILPIELVSFTGQAEEAVNALEWTTVSERNSARFQVLRSTDGTDFSPIGEVPAAGWSTSMRSYRFEDASPPRGTAYYRLDLQDADGSSEPSDLVVITRKGDTMAIWPNPTEDAISVSSMEASVSRVELWDALGRSVAAIALAPGSGLRTVMLDLSHLAPGHYTVLLLDDAHQVLDRADLIRR